MLSKFPWDYFDPFSFIWHSHCGTDGLKRTATIHILKLKGELKVCEDCALAKVRQKNLNQDWKGGSQTPGERVYLDISSIRDKSYGGSRFWVLIVDDYTDYCLIIFLKTKGDLKVEVMTLLTDLKIAGVDYQIVSSFTLFKGACQVYLLSVAQNRQ
jgi:hypothetical protein